MCVCVCACVCVCVCVCVHLYMICVCVALPNIVNLGCHQVDVIALIGCDVSSCPNSRSDHTAEALGVACYK